MNIDRSLVKALYDGTATAEQRASAAKLIEADGRTFAVAHHDSLGRADLLWVVVDADRDETHLKRLLCSHNPRRFQFHRRHDTNLRLVCMSDAMKQIGGYAGLDPSEVEKIDLRGFMAASDLTLVELHGGVDYFIERLPDYNSDDSDLLGNAAPSP